MSKVTIQMSVDASELESISDLLMSVGLRRRNLEELTKAIGASVAVVVAKHDTNIIGFGRLVGDGVYYGSLWDIAVEAAWQRRGIGKALVESLLTIARQQHLVLVGLFTGSQNDGFYESLGFRVLEKIHAMTARNDVFVEPRRKAK